jgi:hypothetical protein
MACRGVTRRGESAGGVLSAIAITTHATHLQVQALSAACIDGVWRGENTAPPEEHAVQLTTRNLVSVDLFRSDDDGGICWHISGVAQGDAMRGDVLGGWLEGGSYVVAVSARPARLSRQEAEPRALRTQH